MRVRGIPAILRRVPFIEVAAGILSSEGRVLIAKRSAGAPLGGLWELPGGKVEPGETSEEAVRRELSEELGVAVRVEGLFATSEYLSELATIRLSAYRVTLLGGTPEPTVHEELRWVSPSELEGYDFAPPDVPIVRALAARA